MSLFDLDSWCGKTCQEPLQATREEISNESSRKLSGLRTRQPLTCLCLKTVNGQGPDACMMRWVDGRLPGDCTMPNFGESPSVDVESQLSQILEETAQPKYYLSPRACQGILKRAEKKGKALPDILRKALETQAKGDGQNVCDAGEPPERFQSKDRQFRSMPNVEWQNGNGGG